MSTSQEPKNRISRSSSIALQRWNILKEVLLSGKTTVLASDTAASLRRFKSYGLIEARRDESQHNRDKNVLWFVYTASLWPDFSMFISHLLDSIKPESLLGFNNTGNVCVWPAEEVMTYYCLQNHDMFREKSVIELGGGMTCLAGVALSIAADLSAMELTDGNENSVSNLNRIITRNSDKFRNTVVKSRVLRWGEGDLESCLTGQYDYVLCADCLFFDAGREDLVHTIFHLLKPEGVAIIFAPQRGDTFNKFVALAQNIFLTEVSEQYSDTVWNLHCKMKEKGLDHYDANIHYPWFLTLKKQPNSRKHRSDGSLE